MPFRIVQSIGHAAFGSKTVLALKIHTAARVTVSAFPFDECSRMIHRSNIQHVTTNGWMQTHSGEFVIYRDSSVRHGRHSDQPLSQRVSVPGGEIVRALLFAILLGALAWSGCGGGDSAGSTSVPTRVAVSPKGQSVSQGRSLTITADVFPDFGQGVTWSLSGPGFLTQQTFNSVTYTAPSDVSSATYAVVTATSVANTSVFSYAPLTVLPINVFGNVQPVRVDGGPVPGQIYANGAFTSVIICAPGTLTCTKVDGILVDTGSSGLRVLASALPSLPPLADSKGNPISECVQFPDQSYVWGQIALADVRIAGEAAPSISVHLLGDPASGSIPTDCTSSGAGLDQDSQMTLGANGILGVGLEPQDCGLACDPSAGGSPPGPAYYSCSGATCNPTFVPLAQQVTHPAVLFAKDNNGVVLQIDPLADAAQAATLGGSITFGIGTQTNNVLGDATIFTTDSNDNFTTVLVNSGQSLTSSFISSGLAGFFFPDSNLPVCVGARSSYFCPATVSSFTATNIGTNHAQGTTNFSVDNGDNLFANNPIDAAFSTLGGPTPGGGACPGAACSFEWGLPFFYGRNVFISINGQSVPASAPAAPWWAYTTGFSAP
jgi:hypothetical protein